MLSLDKKDREILFQLDLDSRQPNSAIARKVRLSKEVVGYRIARMERDGIIEGYYALVDMARLGYLNGRIFIKLSGASPTDELQMISEFEKNPRCWWVNSISGSFTDMGIAYWLKDIADFQAVKEELLDRHREKIEHYRESVYSGIHMWRRNYLSTREEKRKYDFIPGSSKAVEFDRQDIRLLSSLSKNARMPLVELAKKAGLSPTAAKYRLNRLEKDGVILGFRPKISLAKAGLYWYKVEFQLQDNSKKKAMLSYFGSHPNIIYAYESIGGGTDIELEMEVESHEQFREVINAVRTRFNEAIRTYVYCIWSTEHKVIFFPLEKFFEK